MNDGWGPIGKGKGNHNMEGVEIIANDDKDVLPVQQEAAARLVAARSQKWGWDPKTGVFGHGELNPGWKQDTEGMTVTNAIRSGTATLPDYSQTVPRQQIDERGIVSPTPTPVNLAQPLSSQANLLTPRSQTQAQPQAAPTRVAVPEHIAPYLDYWASYYKLDRDTFARMIGHESEFDPKRVGGAGEVGLGQLLPSTARYLGVKDSTDINENLRGSAQYLREMLDHPKSGGDYRKALMLYNSGPGGSFRNTQYADAVLGRGGGVQSGDVVGGGYRAGGAAAFVPTVQGYGDANALAVAGGQKPGSQGQGGYTPEQQAALDRAKAGLEAVGGQGMDDKMRIAQALGILGSFAKGIKFTPVAYDPFKVIKDTQDFTYKPEFPMASMGRARSTASTGVSGPVESGGMARGTRGTSAEPGGTWGLRGAQTQRG